MRWKLVNEDLKIRESMRFDSKGERKRSICVGTKTRAFMDGLHRHTQNTLYKAVVMVV